MQWAAELSHCIALHNLQWRHHTACNIACHQRPTEAPAKTCVSMLIKCQQIRHLAGRATSFVKCPSALLCRASTSDIWQDCPFPLTPSVCVNACNTWQEQPSSLKLPVCVLVQGLCVRRLASTAGLYTSLKLSVCAFCKAGWPL